MDKKRYEVIAKFKGSPDGCRVLDYEIGQQLEVNTNFSEDLAATAIAEGWTKEVVAKAAPKKKVVKKSK